MTKPNQVTIDDVKVEESGNEELYSKLGEMCMNEKEANLAYWWAAQSWGNNYPDGTAHQYVDVKSATITNPIEVIVPSIKWGDADCNGEVEINDAVLVMSYVSNKTANTITAEGLVNADVNANGDGISSNDALSIQKFLANVLSELPESYLNKN